VVLSKVNLREQADTADTYHPNMASTTYMEAASLEEEFVDVSAYISATRRPLWQLSSSVTLETSISIRLHKAQKQFISRPSNFDFIPYDYAAAFNTRDQGGNGDSVDEGDDDVDDDDDDDDDDDLYLDMDFLPEDDN